MGDEVIKLKTDDALLRDLRDARKPSAEEVREQRISFVMGSLDSGSTMTRDQVRKLVEEA